jgi:mRNA interferase MazF
VGVYIPAQGDFVVLTFDPQAGHEQMGRRPALVVSVNAFNLGTQMAICCPVTNTNRRSPFHIAVPDSSSLTGFVMCEQVKSIDYRSRKVEFVEKSPSEFLNEVLAVIDASLYPQP